MAHDHRMNPVGSNHRPTPRIAQALQRYYKIDSDTAYDIIDEHRAGNEELGDEYYGVDYSTPYHPDKPVPDGDNIGSRIGYIPQAIGQAVDARSGKDSQGYSSPYEYPPTVKVKESKDPAAGIF